MHTMVYGQLDHFEQISGKFGSEYEYFHSEKYIRKCRLQNDANFLSSLIC